MKTGRRKVPVLVGGSYEYPKNAYLYNMAAKLRYNARIDSGIILIDELNIAQISSLPATCWEG